MARPEQVPHGWMKGRLFRIACDGCVFRRWHGHNADPQWTEDPAPRGTIVRCVMVSRLGDCGITDDLSAESGYDLRLDPEELVDVGS